LTVDSDGKELRDSYELAIIDLINARISNMASVLPLSASKRLMDAGFPQDQTESGWVETQNGASVWGRQHRSIWSAAAPTTDELLGDLPGQILNGRRQLTLSIANEDGIWIANYVGKRRRPRFVGHGGTVIDALAELWMAVHGGDGNRAIVA
jgi:hypothetical protein